MVIEELFVFFSECPLQFNIFFVIFIFDNNIMDKLFFIATIAVMFSCSSKSPKEINSLSSGKDLDTSNIDEQRPIVKKDSVAVIPRARNTLPSNLKIEVKAVVVSANTVEYTIETNIPLPVEMMASINLKNQKPEDIYIGADKKIRVDMTPYAFKFDINTFELPSGDYEAEVTFYPRWGANDGNAISKGIKSVISDTYDISLSTEFGSAEEKKSLDLKQSWVMNNVVVGTHWDKDLFIEKLGNFEELRVSNSNPDIVKIYYFPNADMSIFVSKPLQEVLTWRMGKSVIL